MSGIQDLLVAINSQGEWVMGMYENTVAFASNERELSIDKLITIDGIAEKTAAAMYEIGVHGYADLAQYLNQHTAQEVSEALTEHGLNRPPALIDKESWTRQAELFSQSENAAPTLPEGETEPAQKPEETPFSPESWEHDAMFAVSFDVVRDEDGQPVLRTTVSDEKNADQEEVFQGSDLTAWVNWISERADLPIAVQYIPEQAEVTGESPPTGTEAAVPSAPTEPYDALLKIDEVEVSVVGPSSAVPENRLRAEINFQLSGSDAETLTSQRIPFRIEGYTVDVDSGVSELVGSSLSRLEPQVFGYRGQQEFAIPDVGRYEFYNIVLLLPPGEMVAYHRGPTIRVVP
jgi:hypothetical protein